MRAERLLEILSDQPIIAAVKNNEEFQRALQSDVGVIFLLYGNILTVSQLTAQVHDCGKLVFVHLDMIEGLASKEVAADFIAGNTVADGVISTKAALTRRARELGLVGIQRFFLLDSKAMLSVQQFSPSSADLVEVLPGLMPKIITRVAQRTPTSGRCKKAKPPPGENFSPGGGHYGMGVWIIMLYPRCALAADHQHEITVCQFHGGDGSLTKVLIRTHDCMGQISSAIFLSGKCLLEHFVVLSQLVE